MKLIDELIHPATNLQKCHEVMKRAAHENARLRSMLFQFLDGGDTQEFRVKVMNVLGIAHRVEYAPDRITDDKQFSPLRDEN
jgi:hypothetical protein